MNKTRRSLPLGLGVPTILVVFIILCMCILSVLTYMNAASNHTSWKREKEMVVSYYEADTIAKQIVRELRRNEDTNAIEKEFHINFEKVETKTSFRVIIKSNKYLFVTVEDNGNVLGWKSMNEEDDG